MEESASPGLPVIRSRSPIMPKRSSSFDFRKPVAYDAEAKRAFHRHARPRLKQLADALGLPPGAYDLRSNLAGIAVCGGHDAADHVYVQACQPATGHDTGLMVRTCQRRNDYHGGPNHFASLDLLNRPDDLARRIREACRV
jgi:hypothetical protein